MRILGVVIAALLMSHAAQAQTAPVATETLSLTPGFATTYFAPKSFSEVVVGNAAVVEAVPRSDRTVVISAKEVGITNLLFLDSAGMPVMGLVVSVGGGATPGIVHMHTKVGNVHAFVAYQCSPQCIRIEDKFEGTERLPPPPMNVINIPITNQPTSTGPTINPPAAPK